jgi:biotin-(acetyl-CoA carboxylase) ligase
MAVHKQIEVTGRAAIEAVLTLSAQEVAGPKHPGKTAGEIGWYGRQQTTIPLAERKLRVEKPRLRREGSGPDKEMATPAYKAMLGNSRLRRRMLEILMHRVSTRNYRKVLPQLAETVAVSKSNVSREFVEASEQTLKELCERRFEGKEMLIVYLGGKKVAGILVESKTCRLGFSPCGPLDMGAQEQHGLKPILPTSNVISIIGIGINCHQTADRFPSELQATATSLDLVSGTRCQRVTVAKRVLTSLDHWLRVAARNGQQVIDLWSRLSTQLGQRVTLSYNKRRFTGNCIGVDPEKGLILQLDRGGVRMFDAAHTHIVK